MPGARSVKNPVDLRCRCDRILPMTKAGTDSERTTPMTRLSGWITGVLVVTGAFMCAAVAQTGAKEASQARGVLPSGLGDAVDLDVTKVRDATARFKTSEAAEAAGYTR